MDSALLIVQNCTLYRMRCILGNQCHYPPFYFVLFLCHTFPVMEVLILLYFLVPFWNLMYCKVFYMCSDSP